MRTDLQAAIEYFETYSKEYKPVSNSVPKYILDDLNEQTQLYRTALTALRDMMRRREGCDTCLKGKAHFGYVLWAINRNGKAVININGEQANTVFPCCPNCGRPLSGNPEQGDAEDDAS